MEAPAELWQMPPEWARQCRLNAAHAGPFSRSGLCPPCRRAMRAAAGHISGKKGGGQPRKSAYYIPPSWLPSVRRGKRRREAEVAAENGVRQPVRQCRRGQGLEHRVCFRCRRREDKCRKRGCLPLTAELPREKLESFLEAFDAGGPDMRRSSDCWDVEVMRRWATATEAACGMKTALLGLIVAAHFKSLRTWGVINSAFGE